MTGSSRPLLPGSTLGVLGGGQLGRMLALAAARMGYRTEVFAPPSASGAATPAGSVATGEVRAHYEDEEALAAFAARVDVVTLEFENIPVAALEAVQARVPVRPGPQVLFHTQNRAREKAFLARHGFPHARTEVVPGPEGYDEALARIGTPAVLKTAGFGYDGKGQLPIGGGEQGDAQRKAALAQLATGPGVLEAFVDLRGELSVIVARTPAGEIRPYGAIGNFHRNGILDISSAPLTESAGPVRQAEEMALEIAELLGLEGLLCVEFFETTGGELLVNEIAPRPHNSGHLTIEAAVTSQFEQQLRAVCGLPLGNADLLRPAAMANLLGDLWASGEPNWQAVLALEGVALHLYGKEEPRPGRKMGHLTCLADSAEEAVARVERARRVAVPEAPAGQ